MRSSTIILYAVLESFLSRWSRVCRISIRKLPSSGFHLFALVFFGLIFANPDVLLAKGSAIRLFPCDGGSGSWDMTLDLNGNPHIVYHGAGVYHLGSTDRGLTWNAQHQRLDEGGTLFGTPSIAVDASNRLHVVWQEERTEPETYEIYHKRSLDGGWTWSDTTRLSAAPASWSKYPDVACYDQGVHVAWVDASSDEVHYKRSIDGGANFLGSDVPISSTGGQIRREKPGLFADLHGVHAAFSDGTNEILYYRKSGDWGVSWPSPVIKIDDRDNTPKTPNVSADPAGSPLYVSWRASMPSGQNELFYRRSTYGGDFFYGIQEIPNSDYPDNDHGIDCDNGDYYFSYALLGTGDVLLKKSTDSGQTWSQNLTPGLEGKGPIVRVAGADIHLVWRGLDGYLYYKKVNTSPKFDLTVSRIEVNQAIQEEDNYVPLVAGKPTVVRVYIDPGRHAPEAGIPGPTVKLYYTKDDGPEQGPFNPTSPSTKPFKAKRQYNRSEILQGMDALNFYFDGVINPTMEAGSYDFRAVIEPYLGESNALNNEYLAYINYIQDRNEMTILWFTARTASHGYPNVQDFTSNFTPFLQKVYPVSPTMFSTKAGGRLSTIYDCLDADNPLCVICIIGLLKDLHEHAEWEMITGRSDNCFATAIVQAGALGSDGQSLPGFRRASIITDGIAGGQVLAHEMGHNYALEHTLCREDIGPGGFDVANRKGTSSTLMSLMCTGSRSFHWISGQESESLFVHHYSNPLSKRTGQIAGKLEMGDYTLISGIVRDDDSLISLNAFNFHGSYLPSLSSPGEYSLEFLDAGDSLLDALSLNLSFRLEDTLIGVSGFFVASAWDTLTHRIVFKHNDNIVGNIQAGENPPVVKVLYPNGGESIGGTDTILWEGSDADGDSLCYNLLYSQDGITWTLLAPGLSDTSFIWDTELTPGGENCHIKVYASDGINTVQDSSDGPFLMGTKSPFCGIVNPVDSSQFLQNELLSLQGVGNDAEDGLLTGTSLSWSSDIDGELGTGGLLSIATLSIGQHTITLTAEDSDANLAYDSILTTILADSDSDGMADEWENSNGLDPYVDDSELDPDDDTLDNYSEHFYQTDPQDYDSDDDTYSDGEEVARESDPNDPESVPTIDFLSAFSLIYPIEGVMVGDQTPALVWEESESYYPDVQVSYRVYYAQDSLFSNVLSFVSDESPTVFEEPLEDGMTYYWKVKAFDRLGHYIWSDNVGIFLTDTTYANQPPVITSGDLISCAPSDTVDYTATAYDPEGENISIWFEDLPSWLSVNGDTVSGLVQCEHQDTSFRLIASDEELADSLEVTVFIDHSNMPPTIESPGDTLLVCSGESFAYYPSVIDPDDEVHSITYLEYPHWCSVQNDSVVGVAPDSMFLEALMVAAQDYCNADTLSFMVQTYLSGDANGDGTIDLGDVLFVVSYLYKGGPAPDPYEAGDCNGDGTIDLGDLLYLVSYLYKGGPAPDCPR